MEGIWHGILMILTLLSNEPAAPPSSAREQTPVVVAASQADETTSTDESPSSEGEHKTGDDEAIDLSGPVQRAAVEDPASDEVSQPMAPVSDEATMPRDLALGHNHTCQLEDGAIECWGSNYFGQLTVPNALDAVIDITAADQNTCALTRDRAVCWGIDGDWQRELTGARSITTGGFHVCGLDASGPWCERGGNEYGENNIPPGLADPEQIVAGYSHTCALGAGRVRCWGSNEFGESDVPGLFNPTRIAAGAWFTCAIDGLLVICWGDNTFGQLEVPTLIEPRSIMAGHNHACAIDRFGLRCWGRNAFGQADVPALGQVELAVPGTHHTCALTGGTTECWGYDAQGQLGRKLN